jgi:hypothetical protein
MHIAFLSKKKFQSLAPQLLVQVAVNGCCPLPPLNWETSPDGIDGTPLLTVTFVEFATSQ